MKTRDPQTRDPQPDSTTDALPGASVHRETCRKDL